MRKPQAQAAAGLKDRENSGRGSTVDVFFSVAIAWLGFVFLTGEWSGQAALTCQLNREEGL